MTTSLADAQREMAAFLRDPEGKTPPSGIEPRRLQIYRDLVYRNIEGFISSAFPVLRSLYEEPAWEGLVRGFIQTHRCSTPLFLRISEEFLAFLSTEDPPSLRPFEAELAHYEWLELAVDVAEGGVPPAVDNADPESLRASLSPVARLGSYRFPVHRIGPSFQPLEAGEPTFLMVYRDRKDSVQFMELSVASARLIHEVAASVDETVAILLNRIAAEWGMQAKTLRTFAWRQLLDLHESGIIALHSKGSA